MSDPLMSRPVEVTLFEDRAEVVRVAEVALEGGVARLAIRGVSPFIDERSVQARLSGVGAGARVLSAQVRYHARAERSLTPQEIDALEADAKDARARAARALAAKDRADGAGQRLESAFAAWLAGARRVPGRSREPDRLAPWRAALAALERSDEARLAEHAAARRAEVSAADELQRTQARLTAGRVETPRYEATVEVEVDASAATRGDLELRYRVPAALWRPEHLVRLVDVQTDGTATLELVTYATAWQRTGESWNDVAVRFSTARPARAATPPLLTDDVLTSRRKATEERRRVEVDLREEVIARTGVAGTRAVDELPGVDDGGEPALLAPGAKVSLPSDGRPMRVEVERATLAATVSRVVMAELSPAAHLVARATLKKGGPLLAGPLRLARGASLVGRSKIAFVAAGEPFEVGFGPDDGVRVRRAETEERDTATLTGTQKVRRTVKVHLSNLSGAARRVVVVERSPVSEIDAVEVAMIDRGSFRAEGSEGLQRAEVDLEPGATRTLELVYEVRAAARVVLPP